MDVFHIWERQTKPFYKESDVQEFEKEFWGTPCAGNVIEPTLTVFRPSGESGIGVVILPGGGYNVEAIHAEGYDIAKVLADYYLNLIKL